ncbi:MAG: phosphoribosylformylglycinamidine synthase I [Candidatus Omnitrophica bacterium]|nr:phosphoribosylformylglycinamidine synthase I [Candidatus Omnitrophota bacterium]
MANKKLPRKKVKALVLRSAGTNCDQETAFAFQRFGVSVELAHINLLVKGGIKLADYHILAIPGGFTYGDDIESGRVLANELRVYLADSLRDFIRRRKLIIGICNGFQILVKAGILPGADSVVAQDKSFIQTATLTNNNSGKFEDRWVHLRVSGRSVWTEGLPGQVFFPVAHAEGKFIPINDRVARELKQNQQIVFRYCSPDGINPVYPQDPNGSYEHIAGITDATGHVLGLMPHPERHFLFTQHPFWTRLDKKSEFGDGAKIFENGVNYARVNI